MTKQLSVREFFKQFPDDDTCLEHLMAVRYGNPLDCPHCGKNGKFHRRKNRPLYECQWCSYQISPMAGTPFERSRTPLQKWFYAIYLFTTSWHGVPAKELQRQLSVTYKTAWRMGHEIRKYMGEVDGDDGLTGHVGIDEAYVGGRDNNRGRPGKNSKKIGILDMVQRGGNVMTKVIPDVKRTTLIPVITSNVAKGSTITTDEMGSYMILPRHGYKHDFVCHNADEWKKGIHHTNSIEGFWARLKLSIRGTHIHVSRKHLPKYLAEFEYRHKMRANPSLMFEKLLANF